MEEPNVNEPLSDEALAEIFRAFVAMARPLLEQRSKESTDDPDATPSFAESSLAALDIFEATVQFHENRAELQGALFEFLKVAIDLPWKTVFRLITAARLTDYYNYLRTDNAYWGRRVQADYPEWTVVNQQEIRKKLFSLLKTDFSDEAENPLRYDGSLEENESMLSTWYLVYQFAARQLGHLREALKNGFGRLPKTISRYIGPIVLEGHWQMLPIYPSFDQWNIQNVPDIILTDSIERASTWRRSFPEGVVEVTRDMEVYLSGELIVRKIAAKDVVNRMKFMQDREATERWGRRTMIDVDPEALLYASNRDGEVQLPVKRISAESLAKYLAGYKTNWEVTVEIEPGKTDWVYYYSTGVLSLTRGMFVTHRKRRRLAIGDAFRQREEAPVEVLIHESHPRPLLLYEHRHPQARGRSVYVDIENQEGLRISEYTCVNGWLTGWSGKTPVAYDLKAYLTARDYDRVPGQPVPYKPIRMPSSQGHMQHFVFSTFPTLKIYNFGRGIEGRGVIYRDLSEYPNKEKTVLIACSTCDEPTALACETCGQPYCSTECQDQEDHCAPPPS